MLEEVGTENNEEKAEGELGASTSLMNIPLPSPQELVQLGSRSKQNSGQISTSLMEKEVAGSTKPFTTILTLLAL